MKIKGMGLPFSVHQSSCSNRTPKEFTWTTDDADIEVWMDYHIMEAINVPIPKGKKRYAWFCESRAIVPILWEAFNNNNIFEDIVNLYDGIFTCEKALVDKHDKMHFCSTGSNLPWTPKDDYKIHDKAKLCSFLGSSKKMTRGHKFRHNLYDILKVQLQGQQIVHLFGSMTGKPFGENKDCHLDNNIPWHDKTDALKDFMFSIVIENDQYDDYFTEKITDCFATGTIPIYYGTKNIGDYFNTDGIIEISMDVDIVDYIIKNKLTEELYYGKMDAIEDNFERVKNMQSADDMLFDKIQELNQ
jgi:hypothetical protein